MPIIFWNLFAILALNLPTHEFHVSRCLIEYLPERQTVQVSLHIFLDDLELALQKQGIEKLHLCTELEHPKAETYLLKYLAQRFQISLDKTPSSLTWVGKEISDDLSAAWCYFEITKISDIQELNVQNDLLLELYDDQKNIVQIKKAGAHAGYFLFKKGEISGTVSF